FHVVLAI
nr:zona pellucida-binding protein, AWN-1=C6 fragment [swine, sperm, Peptide Partial, 7 aa] [Sus scrofa]